MVIALFAGILLETRVVMEKSNHVHMYFVWNVYGNGQRWVNGESNRHQGGGSACIVIAYRSTEEINKKILN